MSSQSPTQLGHDSSGRVRSHFFGKLARAYAAAIGGRQQSARIYFGSPLGAFAFRNERNPEDRLPVASQHVRVRDFFRAPEKPPQAPDLRFP